MFCAQYNQYAFLPQYWYLIFFPNTDIVIFSAQNVQLIFLRIVHLIFPPPTKCWQLMFFCPALILPSTDSSSFYPSTSYILSSPSSDRLYFPLRTDSSYCAPCKAKLSASTYWKSMTSKNHLLAQSAETILDFTKSHNRTLVKFLEKS